MHTDETISRIVLSDRIKERLLDAILSGRYPPGSRIVETRVAKEVGTSQAPVREALRDLEALGLVEIEAFRGARVRHPSAHELLEAFGVRSALESFGVVLAVPRLGPTELGDLEADLEAMRRAADEHDAPAQAAADARFHARVIEATENRALERVWRRLEPFLRTYITILLPGADLHHLAELHAPVLDALRRGDPVAASAALQDHFAKAAALVEQLWPDADSRTVDPARHAAGHRGHSEARSHPATDREV